MLSKEDRAGLYITIIVHLVVLIILLAAQLGASIRKENSFVLDFTKMEELERLEKELNFQQQVNDRLEQMLAEQGVGTSSIRNVAVDRSALKDDRGTDAEKLYKDAERLQKELNSGFDAPEDNVADPVTTKKESSKEEKKATYSGPSVVSYELAGRKASKLPIPAYRCMGAGEVTVLIVVDNSGSVVGAKVDEAVSATDGCLRSFAIRAARLSKFSVDQNAPARQSGNIVYSFIAQ